MYSNQRQYSHDSQGHVAAARLRKGIVVEKLQQMLEWRIGRACTEANLEKIAIIMVEEHK